MSTKINTARVLCAAALGTSLSSPAFAGGVTAGSLITNTASATYTSSSVSQSVDSNTVTFTVDELLDTTVVSQDSGTVSATTTAVLKYKVTNTGNGSEAFTLTANPNVVGNSFNTTITGLAIDVNGNGVYDAGTDTSLTNGGVTSALAADGFVNVLVMVSIPGSANANDTSKVELVAAAVTGTGAAGTVFSGQGSPSGDAVVGASGATAKASGILSVVKTLVALNKTATIADPFGGTRAVPNAVITYKIVADVTGNGTATGLAITDIIPTGTSYQAGTLTLEGGALTDSSADSDGGKGSSSGVEVQLGDVAAGSQRTVTFKVKIN